LPGNGLAPLYNEDRRVHARVRLFDASLFDDHGADGNDPIAHRVLWKITLKQERLV
jgi:hypothetical protein